MGLYKYSSFPFFIYLDTVCVTFEGQGHVKVHGHRKKMLLFGYECMLRGDALYLVTYFWLFVLKLWFSSRYREEA